MTGKEFEEIKSAIEYLQHKPLKRLEADSGKWIAYKVGNIIRVDIKNDTN